MNEIALNSVFISVPVLMLAWANGANDACKGVATLLGSGTASGRNALLWGALWTVAGGLAAVIWGAALVSTFSNGFLTSGFPVTTAFIVSALAASPLGLPVSTTHVSTGSLLGIRWADRAGPTGHDALVSILFAWLITLPVAGGIAALTTLLIALF